VHGGGALDVESLPEDDELLLDDELLDEPLLLESVAVHGNSPGTAGN